MKKSGEIDLIAEKRIKQFIKEGWREVQIVTPIIIKNAIYEIYNTPFRLLDNFEKKIFANEKKCR